MSAKEIVLGTVLALGASQVGEVKASTSLQNLPEGVNSSNITAPNPIEISSDGLNKFGVHLRSIQGTMDEGGLAQSENQEDETNEYQLSAPRRIALERPEEREVFSGHEQKLLSASIRYNVEGRQFEAIIPHGDEELVVTQSGQAYFSEGSEIKSVLEGTSEFSLAVGAQLSQMKHLWGTEGERERSNEEVAEAGNLVVAVENGENVVVALEVKVGTAEGEISLPPESYITYNSDGSVDDYIERLDIEGMEEETVYGPLGEEMSYWLEQNFDVKPDPSLPIFHQVDENGSPLALTVKDRAGQKYGIVLVDLPGNETPPLTPTPFKREELARAVDASEPNTSTELIPRVDLPTYNPHDPEIANSIFYGGRTGVVKLSEVNWGPENPRPGETYIAAWGNLKSIEEATRVIPDVFDPENAQFVYSGYDMILSIENPNGVEMFVSVFIPKRIDHVNGSEVVAAWDRGVWALATGGVHGSSRHTPTDEIVQRIRAKDAAMGEGNHVRIGIDFAAPFSESELTRELGISNCADNLSCRLVTSSNYSNSTTPTLYNEYLQQTGPSQTLNMSFVSSVQIRLP